MAKRVREEDSNPSEGLRSSDLPKRGRGRPRKEVSSPVAKSPPPSQSERPRGSNFNRHLKERLRKRNKENSKASTPPPSQLKRSGDRCFFKVFFADTSQKLRIPPSFRKHINTRYLGTVSLRGPSRNIWQVELVRISKEFYFETGWEDFVFDHSLKTSDVLLFHQDGTDNNFTVRIFDRSACEKESAFLAAPKSSLTSPQEPINSLAIVKIEPDDFPDARPLVPCIKVEPLGIAEPPTYFNWIHYSRERQIVPVKPKRVRMPAVISQRRPVTQEEIDSAFEKARAFQSENPSFMIVMRTSYVYVSFFLAIRTEVVKKYLPKSSAKLTLVDPSGRSWTIQYICGQGKNGAFSGGWARAAVENNLELDDVVVFEVVEKNRLIMHVYRVVEEIAPFKRGSEAKRFPLG